MAAAYSWADLVVSRAGAMTIAELTVAGVASVLVPFPYATNDHQTRNAQFVSERGAAILLAQQEFEVYSLVKIFQKLEIATQHRLRIQQMAQAASELGKKDAVKLVAKYCMEAIHA